MRLVIAAKRLRRAALLGVVLTMACSQAGQGGPALPAAVLVGAGDIASCRSSGDEATARLLDRIQGTVFTAGDNVYERGTLEEFRQCFDTSWGRHKRRIRPTPGNHDYLTRRATGYYTYFGAAAGPPQRGYYSYTLGAWHIIALNSNCAAIGGCGEGSPQLVWLRADLAAHQARCTLAYWHHPRFSSGPHGDDPTMGAFWDVLYQAGADVVVNGHDHHYERFAPQTPDGRPHERGIQQFTVGTGGRSLYPVLEVKANSINRSSATYGVLVLTLRPERYEWRFVPTAPGAYNDAGSRPCH